MNTGRTTTGRGPPPGARGRWSRRQFLRRAQALGLSGAGLALLAGCGSRSLSIGPSVVDPLPSPTKIRLGQIASICQAPLFLAAARLQAEGVEAEYVLMPTSVAA